MINDRVIGILSVQSKDLLSDDVPAITVFANQMAVTYHKSLLMKELAQNLNKLKVYEIKKLRV